MVGLYILVLLTGSVAGGLYIGLFMFPPPVTDRITVAVSTPPVEQTEPSREQPIEEVEAPIPPFARPTPPPKPVTDSEDDDEEEEYVEPPDRPYPRTRRVPNVFGEDGERRPGGFGGRGQKSETFRDARRNIFRDGIEPDWSQFDDEEREMLEKVWERYERRKVGRGKRGNRRNRND